MIVKDEAHIIQKTLENITDYVNLDYWVICDTGSTDDTVNIIETFFKEKNINGEIYYDKWRDFSYNRNKALERAKNKSDYILIFDADDEIHGNFKIPDKLTHDMYEIIFGGGFNYVRGAIVNNRKDWHYLGVLHETIHPKNWTNQTTSKIEGNYYFVSGKTGNRSKNPNKYRDDANILSQAFETENEEWLKVRYSFYAAQSYKDCGEYENAIKWYKKRLEFGGWEQELFYSSYQIGIIYHFNLKDTENGLKYFLKTLSYDKHRYEGLYQAVDFLYNHDNKMAAWFLLKGADVPLKEPNFSGKLFIDEGLHNFTIFWQIAFIAGWCGDINEARAAFTFMLDHPMYIPEQYIRPMISNISFFEEDTKDYYISVCQFLYYTISAWQHLTNINEIELLRQYSNKLVTKCKNLDELNSIPKVSDNVIKKHIEKYNSESRNIKTELCSDNLTNNEIEQIQKVYNDVNKEEIKKQEEEIKKQEEKIKKQKEEIKKQEEEIKKQEEEIKKQEEEIKKQEEETKKQEEETKKQEEQEIISNFEFTQKDKDEIKKGYQKVKDEKLLNINKQDDLLDIELDKGMDPVHPRWDINGKKALYYKSENIKLMTSEDENISIKPPNNWSPFSSNGEWTWGNENSDILLTITSCKRKNLFIRTVDSLSSKIQDISKISQIICIDDQSSKEDISFLKNRYPWIKFIVKSESDKGHKKSMQMIYNLLKEKEQIKYWMHLEDDWEFFIEDNYITKSIEYLNKYSNSHNVKQILFNKGYSEILNDETWICGEILEDGLSLHVKDQENAPCGYWPHYSFRPSITLKNTIMELGDFYSPSTFFELAYAYKYFEAGYKSAYFDRVSCIHIGKLAGARGKDTQSNAYELNNEEQGIGRKRCNGVRWEEQHYNYYPAYCINLDKRIDRHEEFSKKCPLIFTRIPAVDGNNLNLFSQEKDVLRNLYDKWHIAGETGCKMSHYRIWNTCKEKEKGCFIFEDDVVFDKNCIKHLENLKVPNECDMIYICGQWVENYGINVKTNYDDHYINEEKLNKYFIKTEIDGLFKRKPYSIEPEQHHFNTPLFRCTGGYLVTKSGMKKLIKLASYEENNLFINKPIDLWFIEMGNKNKLDIYDYFPHPVSQVWDPSGGDIRRDKFTKCIFDTDVPVNNYVSIIDNNKLLPVQIINLEKSSHRMKNFNNIEGKYNRFNALDGNNIINYDEYERTLLETINNYPICVGEIGCKLSHSRIWRSITENTIILEDDVHMPTNDVIETISRLKIPSDCDLIYIGGTWNDGYGPGTACTWDNHVLTSERFEKCYIKTDTENLFRRKSQILDESNIHPFDFHGFRCLGSYVVTTKGAQKLSKLMSDDTITDRPFITEAADNWIIRMGNRSKINIYEHFPHLVTQIWNPEDTNILRLETPIFKLKRKTVKFLGPEYWWQNDEDIMNHFGVMCDNLKWGNLLLTTEKTADIYVIINKPSPNDYYEPNKTIVFQMEPYIEKEQHFWGEWSNPDKNKFFHINDHKNYLNAVQTQFRIPDNISLQSKQDIVSSIQSHKSGDNSCRLGHKLRIEFLQYVDANCPELFNVYGRENYHSLLSYKGSLDKKENGYLKYKYYFMAESEDYDNYATEKIWEPILCECLCFYWGCPNLGNYIDDKSFIRLDISNPEKSLNIIKTAIKENWWEQRYQNILNAKNTILNKIGMMPTISRITSKLSTEILDEKVEISEI